MPVFMVSFSEIDVHFARLMKRIAGCSSPHLYFASALVSRATCEGHVCLDLTDMAGNSFFIASPSGQEEYSAPSLDQWETILLSTGVAGKPGDYKPLVIDDSHRLYLYRYWEYERILADSICMRASDKVRNIDSSKLREGVLQLFPDTDDREINWQKIAAFVSVIKKICIITGGPGTGKSTVVAKVLALILMQDKNVRVGLAAPTGKAAVRMEQAIRRVKDDINGPDILKDAIPSGAQTVHRLLGSIPGSPYFHHNRDNPLGLDVLVLDEASMVDLPLMSKLVQAIPSDCRFILLGDKDQLASVEPGSVLGDMCAGKTGTGFSDDLCRAYSQIIGDRIPVARSCSDMLPIGDCVVELQKTYRFGSESGIGSVSRLVKNGEGKASIDILKDERYTDVSWRPLPVPARLSAELRPRIIDAYRQLAKASNPIDALKHLERFTVLCALRRGPYGVLAINRIAEEILYSEGLIGKKDGWYHGRPVMVTKNDYNIGLFNGDIGIVFSDHEADNDLRAFFMTSDGNVRKIPVSRLPVHETVYAVTVHKSQGSEFDRVVFVLPDRFSPVVTRELIYTAITRSRTCLEIWGNEDCFVEGVKCRIKRTSGLCDALWKSAGRKNAETEQAFCIA